MPERIDADVCIIGAGAAGITAARELINSGLEVCLLESGGFEYEQSIQDLYKGVSVGKEYPVDSTRLRMFGGTTNHWSGTCRPLDALDFEERAWVPHSGWPINKTHLDPYYARAQEVCQLGPYDYSAGRWETSEAKHAKALGEGIYTTVFQFSPPTRFGAVYRDELKRAGNLRVLLYATVLQLQLVAGGDAVDHVRVHSNGGRGFRVHAKYFVLAAGGIESPRLLLLSDTIQRNGIGNEFDLVGRFFMDHPILHDTAHGMLDGEVDLNYYRWRRKVDGTEVGGFLAFRPQMQKRGNLLNCGLQMRPAEAAPAVRSMHRVLKSLKRWDMPDELGEDVWTMLKDMDDVAGAVYRKLFGPVLTRFSYWAEPQPNPDSRITLNTERDRLGQRKVQVAWRTTRTDSENLARAHRLLAAELGRIDLGRIRLNFDSENGAWPETPELHKSNHHIGTLRMASDAKRGVVDRDCRVHGVDNLYVASSAVFPTAGHANPTLTIVALAIRLADHLQKVTT